MERLGIRQGRPIVCLAMIVRNEAQVIERCLESARPWIDSWVICDTGSTDDTPARIHSALAGIPGVLHQRPWRNFGDNRTELLQLARGHGDYLLLLDADMTVRGDPAVLRGLDADAYFLRLVGDPEYWMPYLVRADLPWRYEGATHEYLTAAQPYRQTKLPGLEIHHHADGGSRQDKFERDRILLTHALQKNPDDARSVFYLAQTYRDLGDWRKAVEHYRRRTAMGGFAEEAFYSLYQVGVLLAPHDWSAAVEALLGAWNMRPSRAEPLYELASGFRQREQYALARLFAERGLAIPLPDDVLFLAGWVYRWGLLFEYSIAAYWTGDMQAAYETCLTLEEQHDIPDPWLTHTRRNLALCQQALRR